MALLDYAAISAADGALKSTQFHDIYFNAAQGFAESDHVFIHGNQLIARFRALPENASFTIAEIGFGSGLNCLNAAQHFLETAPKTARLHLISCEKFPIARAQLAAIQAQWPLPAVRAALLANYPDCQAGFHQFSIHPRITLTLLMGDVAETLAQLDAKVDAWFLDGFAPSVAPEMWSPSVFNAIARLSHETTTLATFTVAALVREHLTEAGFAFTRAPGFGKKRQMLTAHLSCAPAKSASWTDLPSMTLPREQPIAIIGAGLAGAATAAALASYGQCVEVYSSEAYPAASDVPLAVPFFLPGRTPSPLRDFHYLAWLDAHRELRRLQQQYPDIMHAMPIAIGAQAPRARNKLTAYQALLSPPYLSAEAATVTLHGLGAIHTPALLAALLAHPNITHIKQEIPQLVRIAAGWQLGNKPYATVIIASGWNAQLLPKAYRSFMRPIRGQASCFALDAPLPARITCAKHSLIPFADLRHCYFGSTYQTNNADLTPRDSDNAQALTDFKTLYPDTHAQLTGEFVGVRAATRDYLPLIGPLATPESVDARYAPWRKDSHIPISQALDVYPGLFAHLGLGSKGSFTAFLGAKILAAQIMGAPMPVPRNLLAHLLPARYLLKRLKQNRPLL